MKTNYLISINNIKDIEEIKKVQDATFLFALEEYSIGYPNTFTLEEVNNVNEPKYLLINRLLTNEDIDNLKTILPQFNGDGFVFEDVGLINILKETKKDLILFINHFNCSSMEINYWLDYVNSVVISNELTIEEIKEITSKTKGPVCVQIFGYNQVMYSRRFLLKNYFDHFNLPYQNPSLIEDKQGTTKFLLTESKHGTVAYSSKIFDGRVLKELPNIAYFLINSSFISQENILKFLKNEEVANTDTGFLTKKTIYKLEERLWLNYLLLPEI